MTQRHLARRDWIVLPLLSVLTIALIAGSAELLSRRAFNGSKTLLANCLILDDPSTGPRAIPNSVCLEKSPESPVIEYKFDSCGFREGTPCAPKAPGTYRIVVVGSSSVLGELVQAPETFASLLPQELVRRTHRKIEVYNAGMGWGFPPTIPLRMNQILASNPDLILWPLTPADVGAAAVVMQVTQAEREQQSGKLTAKIWMRARQALKSESVGTAILELFNRSRSSFALRHYLFLSQSQHINATLATGGEEFGFLRANLSAAWKNDLGHFDQDFIAVSERAKNAGVPLIVTFLPYPTQASMISLGEWPAAFDPYKLDNELRTIVENRGGTFLDILPLYRTVPDPERGYYPVDTHANPAGHALLAQFLADGLARGAVSALDDGKGKQIQFDAGRPRH